MTQLSLDPEANINLIMDLSKECFPDNSVLADLTAAQAILESRLEDSPPSALALKYNNLFGIKGYGTHRPNYINLPTHEYYRGQWTESDSLFAWNNDIEDSLAQHKQLFEEGTMDSPDRYKNLLTARSFSEAAGMLMTDGYATDPNYQKELLRIYEQYL